MKNPAGGGKDDPQNYNFPELEEYFVYTPGNSKTGAIASSFTGGSTKGIKMTRDSVTYCTSGLVDRNKDQHFLAAQINQTTQSVDDD